MSSRSPNVNQQRKRQGPGHTGTRVTSGRSSPARSKNNPAEPGPPYLNQLPTTKAVHARWELLFCHTIHSHIAFRLTASTRTINDWIERLDFSEGIPASRQRSTCRNVPCSPLPALSRACFLVAFSPHTESNSVQISANAQQVGSRWVDRPCCWLRLLAFVPSLLSLWNVGMYVYYRFLYFFVSQLSCTFQIRSPSIKTLFQKHSIVHLLSLSRLTEP